MRHLWQGSWPARWIGTASGLLRGARIHPNARVYGGRRQVEIAGGSRISAACVLRAVGDGRITVGADVWFAHDVEIETETLVSIGPRTTVQRRCTFNGTTRIGADCIFAPDIFISSGTHPFRHLPHLTIREQERRLAASGVSMDRPVWIQDDCWLGTHVVVCPGVTIGKGSIVGANSVVLHDVPPYSVVAGGPARIVGQRLAWEPPPCLDATRPTDWPYILSGTIERAGDSAVGVRVNPGEPLLIALRAGEAHESLLVDLRCSGPADLRINGRRCELGPDCRELRLSPDPAEAIWATLRIDAEGSAPVVFTRFQWTASQE